MTEARAGTLSDVDALINAALSSALLAVGSCRNYPDFDNDNPDEPRPFVRLCDNALALLEKAIDVRRDQALAGAGMGDGLERAHPHEAMNALCSIQAERMRQIREEGWTAAHDDEHDGGQMADAAACYAATGPIFGEAWLDRTPMQDRGDIPAPRLVQHSVWPWNEKWWKPKDRRSNLVRAGALILAEIERLDRALIPEVAASVRESRSEMAMRAEVAGGQTAILLMPDGRQLMHVERPTTAHPPEGWRCICGHLNSPSSATCEVAGGAVQNAAPEEGRPVQMYDAILGSWVARPLSKVPDGATIKWRKYAD